MDNTETKLVLRPGLIVALSTSVTGGVIYQRKDLDERCGKEGNDAMGAKAHCKRLKDHTGRCDFSAMTAEEIKRWETTRITADKAEHDEAVKVRNKARSLITAVTVWSNFGNLCPTEREAELDEAYKEAKRRVDTFNETSVHTSVGVYMLKATIPDNSQSAQAISSDVVSMIDQMVSGLNNGDEAEVREAANKLTALTDMLDDGAKAIAQKAIAEARSAARSIVKANTEREANALVTIERQREADKKKAAQKQLRQAREALDMNASVLAQIEAATKKAG
jgi:hypothetical protein